jgi:hypothetical protein
MKIIGDEFFEIFEYSLWDKIKIRIRIIRWKLYGKRRLLKIIQSKRNTP